MKTPLDRALDALGDPTRRAIFERLGRAPSSVGEIAREMPVSRPAVSQHLKVLKEAGLVIDKPEGTRRIYRLEPSGVQSLQSYFHHIWLHALTEFKRSIEEDADIE